VHKCLDGEINNQLNKQRKINTQKVKQQNKKLDHYTKQKKNTQTNTKINNHT